MLVWRLAHARGDNAFAKVPAATLANWAAQAPEARVPRLAGVIPLSVPGDEGQVLSEAVLALFDLAPDRLVLLRTLERRLRPTAWGGSLAVVLERRRPLLRPFLADRDPEVQRFAKEIDERLQAEIAYESEREAARDRRDERFE
jgi:hypothetical protein